MKKKYLNIIFICFISLTNAQSKKEIIQELTIENTNLKKEISVLNNKIQVLEAENITLKKDIDNLKKELYVDKVQTPQEYGKTLFDLFVSQRLSKYPELQFQLKDTIYLKFKDVETIKEFINKIQNNSLDFYLEGLNNGIDWSKVKFENFDFEINEPNGDIDINHLEGKFYFYYSGSKYSFKNKVSILENGKWRGYFFKTLVNETAELENEKKEKLERLKEPYVPQGVKFGGVVYSFNSKEVNPKTMYGLTIPIENNTPYAIDWIKFQFRIYENSKLILSKNIIIGEYSNGFDSKLEPGEKEIIELNDIGEVFIGSGVRNGNWFTDVELLEVTPKQIEN